MANGIYIFNDAEDFIKVIEDIEQQYNENKPTNLVKLSKPLFNKSALEKEVKFLNECRLNVFSCFLSKKVIKVNITYNKCDYLVTYYFKGCTSNSKSIYKQFKYYLRKREWE